MSHVMNVQYVESAKEGLEQYIEEGNYEVCQTIIQDAAANGFVDEARDLEEQLLKTPIANFVRILSIDELLTHLEKGNVIHLK